MLRSVGPRNGLKQFGSTESAHSSHYMLSTSAYQYSAYQSTIDTPPHHVIRVIEVESYDQSLQWTKKTNGNEMYVDYLEFKTPTWKRPEGPPRVWRVIDGRRKMENGEIPKFSIQEVPKELEDEVVEFMTQNFLREEPTCKYQGVINDQQAVRESRTLWRNIVRQGMSVIALLVTSDPAAKPVIAGANMLQVVTAEDKADTESDIQMRSGTMRHIFGIMSKMSAEADVMQKYGVDKYLSALGLSVNIAYRGQRLGEELLQARDDIGLAYQIPVSETVFTATASQIIANRVGFEVIHQKKYSELVDDEGKPAYPGVTVEYMQVMAKRLY